jgi:hypothetical protein
MLLLQNMNCSLLTAAVLQVATLRCCPGIRNNITVIPSLATSLARLRTTVVTRRSRIPASRKSAVVGQADLAWATRPRGSLSRRAAWRRRCIADGRGAHDVSGRTARRIEPAGYFRQAECCSAWARPSNSPRPGSFSMRAISSCFTPMASPRRRTRLARTSASTG